MKSCRNCENARHDGYFRTRLICRMNSEVVVPFSINLEENHAADAAAQRRASRCHAYTAENDPVMDYNEGEMK